MIEGNNPYQVEINKNLPRLLSLFDNDPSSKSYGLGDRYHWAWGLIDFANGTFQGAVHGLSLLWKSGLWPYDSDEETFLKRIDSIFQGTKEITRKNGSLEEAFPNEGSYCVTALVAFDSLCAIHYLENQVDTNKKSDWLSIIEPLIVYLIENDESHAFISNHLATAAAALYRWHQFKGCPLSLKKADTLLKKIIDNQSEEGWYLEYEGPDPGYQSLCTYYLSDVYLITNKLDLLASLKKSADFLSHFLHPDGSFGGTYGSRSTRFYYPGGVVSLSNKINSFNQMKGILEDSILNNLVVNLSSIDEPNLIPLFNSYVRSSVNFEKNNKTTALQQETYRYNNPRQLYYPEAGIYIDYGLNHKTIISTYKGGVVYHFSSKNTLIDSGVLLKNNKGKFASSQNYNKKNIIEINEDENFLIIRSKLTSFTKSLPNIYQFLLIRIMSLTLFRSTMIREFVKKVLVRFLITGKKYWSVELERKIKLGENLKIIDNLIDHGKATSFVKIDSPSEFVSFHMASKGYWQVQDETKNDTKV